MFRKHFEIFRRFSRKLNSKASFRTVSNDLGRSRTILDDLGRWFYFTRIMLTEILSVKSYSEAVRKRSELFRSVLNRSESFGIVLGSFWGVRSSIRNDPKAQNLILHRLNLFKSISTKKFFNSQNFQNFQMDLLLRYHTLAIHFPGLSQTYASVNYHIYLEGTGRPQNVLGKTHAEISAEISNEIMLWENAEKYW